MDNFCCWKRYQQHHTNSTKRLSNRGRAQEVSQPAINTVFRNCAKPRKTKSFSFEARLLKRSVSEDGAVVQLRPITYWSIHENLDQDFKHCFKGQHVDNVIDCEKSADKFDMRINWARISICHNPLSEEKRIFYFSAEPVSVRFSATTSGPFMFSVETVRWKKWFSKEDREKVRYLLWNNLTILPVIIIMVLRCR